MVIITRSAYRKACESTNSSDVSQNNIIPPWCSSGKVHERRKPRREPSWEIQSSYPLRENIWEYLHDKELSASSRRAKRAKCNCRKAKRRRGKGYALFLTFFTLTVGVLASMWMNSLPKMSLLANVIPKDKLISLLGAAKATSVGEGCCHKMRCLAAELSRAEQALRHSQRKRRTAINTSQITREDRSKIDRLYIEGVLVTRGSSTEEYGSRVALWGVVPLWRASPPPDTVLALRKPTPSDCWPFIGSFGEVLIELPKNSQILSVSLEHIRPDTARSAPKHFIFYAILENGTWVNAIEGEYNNKGSAKQYFKFNCSPPLKKMVFRVLSNQGNSKYTCLYRIHIYGK